MGIDLLPILWVLGLLLVKIWHKEEFQQICVDTFGLVRKRYAVLSATANTEVQLNLLI